MRVAGRMGVHREDIEKLLGPISQEGDPDQPMNSRLYV